MCSDEWMERMRFSRLRWGLLAISLTLLNMPTFSDIALTRLSISGVIENGG